MTKSIAATGYVEVLLSALARNYATLRDVADGADVAAVVKADAYGLGAARVATFLLEVGCREFFVATLEEGIALRQTIGPEAVVYVFEGVRMHCTEEYLAHDLAPVLNTVDQVESWQRVDAPCAVHVDTGMSRLGLGVDELAAICSGSASLRPSGLQLLMTHLACADDPGSPHNLRQLRKFDEARKHVGDVRVSIANSAGAFLDKSFRGDVVRAGIALYGGNPFAHARNPMEAVVTTYARVLQIRELAHNAAVGYGATYDAPAGARIATVGIGYADGYRRLLGNTAHAFANGVRVPVVGRISMDLTCLDITDLPEGSVAVGDFVEMFGRNVPVDEVAERCDTISYEILTGLGARLPRIYAD